MKITSQLDWISVTILRKKTKIAPSYLSGLKRKSISGKNGYTDGFLYENGSMQFWSENSNRMGTHIVHAGVALQNLRKNDIQSEDILDYHQDHGNRFSRVDYAVDMIGSDAPKIIELMKDHENGYVDTKVRTKPQLIQRGMTQAETMTIGSTKKRTKMLQIYRKDIEQGLSGYADKWLRAELRMYGKNAVKSANVYSESDDKHSATIGLIRGFVDYEQNKAWLEAMNAKPSFIPVDAHKTGNTEKWLIESVVPALARVCIKDETFMSKFAELVRNEIELQKTIWSES